MPEDRLPLIGAFDGPSSSELGGTAPPTEEPAVAEEPADAEELADELALAEASAQPGLPSPMPLPRSASWHCKARAGVDHTSFWPRA